MSDYHGVVGPDGKLYAAPRRPAQLSGHQFVEDNSHVFVPAANGSFNAVRRAEEHLNIHQIVTKQIGTWVKVLDRDSIKVWDGVNWVEFPFHLAVERGMLPHTSECFQPDEIEFLHEVVQEKAEENERMMLRRLLAEQQSDGRE